MDHNPKSNPNKLLKDSQQTLNITPHIAHTEDLPIFKHKQFSNINCNHYYNAKSNSICTLSHKQTVALNLNNKFNSHIDLFVDSVLNLFLMLTHYLAQLNINTILYTPLMITLTLTKNQNLTSPNFIHKTNPYTKQTLHLAQTLSLPLVLTINEAVFSALPLILP